VWPPLSYSFDYTYGYTQNAALLGNSWNMSSSVLGVDVEEGLSISGVIYTYTPIKDKADDFTVTVQNQKIGGGYIFQETDDWSGLTPIRIKKVVPLAYTPIAAIGKGSIETTGKGSVSDASVLYMYRWNPCGNPQNDSGCPGYVPPLPPVPKIEIYDALTDESVQTATEKTDKDIYEDEKREEDEEAEEDVERLEVALASTENALTIANTTTQSAIVNAMNIATNLSAYYVAQIPGKVYQESISLTDQGIPDNRRALKSLSQDRLHNTMLEEQYK
jgi:hypothetical protein